MFYVADPSLIKGLKQFLKIINTCFAWVKNNWLIDFNQSWLKKKVLNSMIPMSGGLF